jgi:predicted component of type VI protein secretion system
MRCLAKSPEERFATGREMADALEAAILSLEGAPTQTMERPQEISQRESISRLISGKYWLLIETPGRKSSHATLTRATVTIGRNADNDIVLPAEGVSRYHARVEATDAGWVVYDMGGINGTWLNEQRLRPGVSLDYTPGDSLEIGPYQIVLDRMPDESHAAALAVAATVARSQEDPEPEPGPSADITEAKTAELTDRPLSVYIARDTFVVEPGQSSELKVDVVNRGSVSDRVSLRVLGLPNQWVELPDSFIRVNPGQSVTISIQIRPPRITETPAGRQRFRIEVKSQQYPEMELAVGATLTLGSYESFEMAMEPRQVSLPALVRVTIRNTGNADAEFSVIGNDPAEEIQFRGERGRIRLQPRQTAAVDLELEAKHRAWFGKSEVFPFRVEVATGSGANQSARGRATISSLLPVALIYIVLFLAIFLCVIAALLFVFQRERLGALPPATESDIESIAMTSTAAISGSATSAVIVTSSAATAAAATAAIIGDRDNDGLSDTQEGIIGTDPDNPDTDSDGLLDGEEVLTWGTEPLIRDTDTDILLDGDEVHTYGTNPTNPDTDGDGIPDGIEIAMGTDPLNPLDPPASPTPTTSAPTATYTVIVATETATSSTTPTSTPSSTPTDTPTTVPTETSTPTSTPSVTPSPTPTVSPTLTPTAVPTPLPDCSLDAPVIDGIVTEAEWGSEPAFTFAPDDDPTRLVKGYFRWVADQLYLAFEVADPTVDQSLDSLRVYFDVNNNTGDPDSADRFFQIVRDNTLTARTGINTNADGLIWISDYDSDDWIGVVTDNGVDAWSIEMQIDAANEMPDLLAGNPFGTMTLVQYTGSLGIWPEGAVSNNAGTWQVVDSVLCP